MNIEGYQYTPLTKYVFHKFEGNRLMGQVEVWGTHCKHAHNVLMTIHGKRYTFEPIGEVPHVGTS
jgi:hypothetical protein